MSVLDTTAPGAGMVDVGMVERDVVRDMVRRCLPALPAVVLVAGLLRGVDGALSASFGAGLAVANLALSALIVSAAARISLVLLGIASLGGFVLRLALVTVAVLLVKDQGWVDLPSLGFTLVLTHLGMLIWEARHVSVALAFPGLNPPARRPRSLESTGG